MNFSRALNPLKGTRFEWLLPFTLRLLTAAATATPTTIEVFLHHRFGARTGKGLLKGFTLLLVLLAISRHSWPAPRLDVFPAFVMAYAVAATCQWLTSRFRPPEGMHSHWNGEPWPTWRETRIQPVIVQRYLEPALTCFIAWVVLFVDPALGDWLFAAAIGLFIKEQIIRAKERTHHFDVLDNRIEAGRSVPRPPVDNDAFVEAREAPPRLPPRPINEL